MALANKDVSAVLQQGVKSSNVFTRGATLFDFLVIQNGSKWRIVDRRRRVISTIALIEVHTYL